MIVVDGLKQSDCTSVEVEQGLEALVEAGGLNERGPSTFLCLVQFVIRADFGFGRCRASVDLRADELLGMIRGNSHLQQCSPSHTDWKRCTMTKFL